MESRRQQNTRTRPKRSQIYDAIQSRLTTVGVLSLLLLSGVPTVSAHDTSSVHHISYWHGFVILVAGLLTLGGSVWLKREGRIRPRSALYGVFGGLVATAVGGILFTELAPETYYSAQSAAFPSAWYQPIALLLGGSILVCSVILGRLRWPTHPRYSVLGMELGLWVAYPALVASGTEYTSPLGYGIVLSVVLTVGYILWTDCATSIRTVLQNRTARRFGAGVSVVVALFFMFAAGFFSFFPETGERIPDTLTITVLPALFPLVTWPTVELWAPSVPFAGMLSVGVVLVVGLISGLVGLNAAIAARMWIAEESVEFNQSASGAAAFVGSNACSCCGPMVAKFVILAMGPSAAAPLYWLFVDLASPAGSLFLVSSIALLVMSLLSAVNAISESPVCSVGISDSRSPSHAD